MTNVRITHTAADELIYCPYCGHKVEWDQSPDLLFRDDDGIDVDRSLEAGYDFDKSLSHCGYHVRLWVADGENVIE